MFVSINTFLGHRLGLSLAAGVGFLALGGLVIRLSIRSLAEETGRED
jgi:hypothetical protein